MDSTPILLQIILLKDLSKKRHRLKQLGRICHKRARRHIMRARQLLLFLQQYRELHHPIVAISPIPTEKKQQFWEDVVPNLSDEKFKEHFRMSRASFDELAELLISMQKETMKRTIPLKKRLAVALYYLGSLAEYKDMYDMFTIGRSTVGDFVRTFCSAVLKAMQKDFLPGYPISQDVLMENLKGFEEIGMPQCYGAVGESHIETSVSKADTIKYLNSRGRTSVILFASADHRRKFMYVDASSPGSNILSKICERSKIDEMHAADPAIQGNIKKLCGHDIQPYLIGNHAIGLSKSVIKAFGPDEYSSTQLNFNKHAEKAQIPLEEAFLHLRARFRKLAGTLSVDVNWGTIMIQACCVLHNFFIERNDNVFDEWVEEAKNLSANRQPVSVPVDDGEDDMELITIRNAIAIHLYATDNLLPKTEIETESTDVN